MELYNHIDEEDNNFVSEPRKSWGGSWTEDKLDAFEKYVKAYLTIMNKYRDKYHWKLFYFDGFAGSGTRFEEDESQLMQDLFKTSTVTTEQLNVYMGAAERVLRLPIRGFDYYYFVDINKDNSDKLNSKLAYLCNDKARYEFRVGDANEQIIKMANYLRHDSKAKALVFLDPFGMSIDWESIASLQGDGVDLWILVPTGMIINRLLEKDGRLVHIEKLKSYFGMTEEEIRNEFFTHKKENSLFGTLEYDEKVKEPIKKIANLYVRRLKTLFSNVTESPLVLYNTRGMPLFHFVFASNNTTASKIAQQIINKKQRK